MKPLIPARVARKYFLIMISSTGEDVDFPYPLHKMVKTS
jgi:hypothetical protein